MGYNLKKATPFLHDFATELIQEAKSRMGLHVVITDVDRTFEMQMALFAQGRRPLQEVNILRKYAGMPEITEIENRQLVTHSMVSKHIVNQAGLSHAIDFGIRDPYTQQISLTKENYMDYQQIGWLGQSVGKNKIIWGGSFATPREYHFEEKLTPVDLPSK